jgi:hypothetical protein
MTFTSEKEQKPKSIRVTSGDSSSLLVHGQGVVLFRHTSMDPLSERQSIMPRFQQGMDQTCIFYVYTPDKSDGFRVELTQQAVLVHRISTNQPYVDPNNKSGLDNHPGAYYWFSIDSQHQTLLCGVGEARVETVIYRVTIPFASEDERKANKTFMESLESIQVALDSDVELLRVLRDPITGKIPAIVKPTETLTMDQIASGAYLPKANLPLPAQQLYDCISGSQFTLDTEDFPDFVQAIENSIKNPSGWCYQKLQAKSHEFSKDKPNLEETYLRITLGQNNGESPGIPYVMEIWPVGHYSPIHNHSAAHAIIRVLQGEITVSQFPYLCATQDGIKPFAVTNFHKDQITWISPTLNQTHQLHNLPENASTCITIQCYLYDQKDTGHYDYFDYVDSDGTIQQYEPDSDMDFVDFKELMKKEWENRLVSSRSLLSCFMCV